MKVYRTITVEIDDAAIFPGQTWGLTEDKERAIAEKLEKIIEESTTVGEIYRRIFEEFEGNEVVYAYGLFEFTRGAGMMMNKALHELVDGNNEIDGRAE